MDQDNALLERINELPDSVAIAFMAPETGERVSAIAKKFNLTQDQEDIFGLTVGLVLLGEIHVSDFAQNVHDSLDLPDDILDSLVREINHDIFEPIMVDLESMVEQVPITETPEDDVSQESEPISSQAPASFGNNQAIPIQQNQNIQNTTTNTLTDDKKREAEDTAHYMEHPVPLIPKQQPQNPQTKTPMSSSLNQTSGSSILDAKLSQTTSLPKQEITIDDSTQKKPFTGGPNYSSSDPYREPPTA